MFVIGSPRGYEAVTKLDAIRGRWKDPYSHRAGAVWESPARQCRESTGGDKPSPVGVDTEFGNRLATRQVRSDIPPKARSRCSAAKRRQAQASCAVGRRKRGDIPPV